MAVQYAPSKLRVPDGFNNLLEGLAREVLRDQPENIIRFAAEYFKTQMMLREEAVSNGSTAPAEPKEEAPAEVTTDEEAKPAEEAPKAEETTSEEDTKTDDTPAAPEEPPKAESPEQPAAEPKLSEDEAAAKIQAVLRGKKARDEVAAMKAAKEDGAPETPAEAPTETTSEAEPEKAAESEDVEESTPEEQEAAALKIQASFRGMQARKEVDAIKSAKEEGDAPAAEAASEGETATEAEN